ncbi:hypothetical protein QNH44_03250 [Cytobacillus firmus]|nr:hypothetical protein [Cytobacillus firmus]WHY34793.1 hypothetical protein QNH44_03250 [Cytobacillus firmus]
MAFAAILTVGQLKHTEEHPASREFFIAGNHIMREVLKLDSSSKNSTQIE